MSNCRSSKGQSTLELAIILPVMLLLLLAAADFGRALFVAIDLKTIVFC